MEPLPEYTGNLQTLKPNGDYEYVESKAAASAIRLQQAFERDQISVKTEPRELMYWLQGFFEVSGAKTLDENQTAKIRAKLESCFEKVTSDYKYIADLKLPPGVYC